MRLARRVLAFLAAVALASSAWPQELCDVSGRVLRRDGTEAARPAADLLGPSNVFTETDRSGRFTARVREGRYVVRLREGDRQVHVEMVVGPCGSPRRPCTSSSSSRGDP